MTKRLPKTLGIRHIALKVKDLEACEKFYVGLLGYQVEWRPDKDNLYLTSGRDNLALHQDKTAGRFLFSAEAARRRQKHRAAAGAGGSLDHLGVILKRPEDVDAWAEHLKSHGVRLAKEPKTHRDGARSFYFNDPEGNLIQFMHHPPISRP